MSLLADVGLVKTDGLLRITPVDEKFILNADGNGQQDDLVLIKIGARQVAARVDYQSDSHRYPSSRDVFPAVFAALACRPAVRGMPCVQAKTYDATAI
jgi:hypothetical protein